MKKVRKRESIFSYLSYIFFALMLGVFLFYFDSSGFSGITEAKLGAFKLICGGYVAAVIILIPSCLLTGMIKKSDIIRIVKNASTAQKLAVLYMLLTILSTVLSDYRSESWQGVSRYEGSLTISIYCLCFIFASSFLKPKSWMIYLAGASAFLFCLICILQLYGLNPFGLYPEGLDYFGADVDYNGAYLGTIGNTDLVAALLCLIIPALTAAVYRLSGKYKYLLLIPLALSLFVLFKMYVLAGFVGAFAGLVLSLPMILKLSDKRAMLLAIIIALLIIISLLFVFLCDSDIGMLHEAHELLNGRLSDDFGSGRIYIWRNVLQRVPDNILFGTGADTMKYSGIEAFSRYDAVKKVQIVAEIDAAHNEYLNVLYNQGIFALLSYLSLLVIMCVKWVKLGRKNTACAVAGAAALGYCIQAFFGISMLITAPFFWLTLGVLDAASGE